MHTGRQTLGRYTHFVEDRVDWPGLDWSAVPHSHSLSAAGSQIPPASLNSHAKLFVVAAPLHLHIHVLLSTKQISLLGLGWGWDWGWDNNSSFYCPTCVHRRVVQDWLFEGTVWQAELVLPGGDSSHPPSQESCSECFLPTGASETEACSKVIRRR